MDTVKIRKARKEDMKAVYALIQELAIYEKEPDAVVNTVEGLIEDGFGENKLFDCIVAEKDETIVGFALFYTSYSTWKGPCLYLEDFIVTASQRGKGIGKKLFDHVYQIAVKRKVKRFEWQVLDWNKPAIDFYQKYKANFDEDWINCKIFL